MEQLLNSQGSYWSKWDLHIHSPESVLSSNFGGDWIRYIKTLEKLKDISVIGITDYFSIKGYKKVKQFKEEGKLQNLDLVLPNIELRLNTTTFKGRAINIHIIFSSEVDNFIEKFFLEELEFEYNGNHYRCTEEDLISLGEIFCDKFSKQKALYEGMKQFKVSLDNLKKVLRKHEQKFKDKYIVVIPNSNVDGNSGNKDDSFKATRRELYRFSHAIFSANESDRSFFLGERNFEETIKQCGKIMPCFHGSDAHDFEKIGKPDQNRFTWIKAEPVFEGLIQVLHEPKERVVIQEEHPDKKNDYDVITTVKFNDSAEFIDRDIKLNSGLNTIIGGKSSGKSLLLYKIAQSVSKEEIQLRENDTIDGKTLWSNSYKGTFIEGVDFEVKWRNGQTSNFLESRQNGQITYIPQMYINALSEDTANSVLQKKIREIILQDNESKEYWQVKGAEGVKLKHELSNHIIELFDQFEKKEQFISDIKRYGDKEAIEKEKVKLEQTLLIKIANANLTSEEEKKIQECDLKKVDINNKINNVIINKESDKKLTNELSVLFELINLKIKTIKDHYNLQLEVLDELHLAINAAFVQAQTKVEKSINIHVSNLESENKKLESIDDLLTPLLEKMRGISAINGIKSKIDEQQEYLIGIERLEKEINEIENKVYATQNRIFEVFKKMYNLKKEIKNYFNTKAYFKDLKLTTYVGFDQVSFNQAFLSIFVRRGKMTNLFPDYETKNIFNENDDFIFSEETFIEKVQYLFEVALTMDKVKYKKGYSKQKAIEELLSSNYTNIIFDLEKDGDRLSEMSPGKRGLVLIELFLDMSNETHPILIDQPEDNLDNRTISTDLVKFVKEKSQQRQIIIVTHNANLVVLTDSENVIVANQDNLLTENDTKRFEYINGALECDFNINNKISGRGIKSHVCEILEGGKEAFEKRERKYGF
ncbi:TrlF family AAA-like ATPase [Bacillus sp. V2I10]|uniref:TrlF family AAA-like ATPase n=1 Tax=Bacillus sp. V2I10 TaxID=3042276 RepID=UPI00277D1FE0|nr:hypothetical protein [Bacillus sp. V2I10]MDQ0862137.1 hypothetical protein [Bacillus sp. V2I10]